MEGADLRDLELSEVIPSGINRAPNSLHGVSRQREFSQVGPAPPDYSFLSNVPSVLLMNRFLIGWQ